MTTKLKRSEWFWKFQRYLNTGEKEQTKKYSKINWVNCLLMVDYITYISIKHKFDLNEAVTENSNNFGIRYIT